MTTYWCEVEREYFRGSSECGTCKPVVVIDPEDREAVGRLANAIREGFANAGLLYLTTDQMFHDERSETLMAALREFANPEPPKPEEPTDPSARVTAASTKWAKVGSWWVSPDMGQVPRSWEFLTEQEDFRVE